jgi:sulfonate transport system ATP-binding protein
MSAPPVVSIRGLSKRFGERTVVADVDLDVAEGEVIACAA